MSDQTARAHTSMSNRAKARDNGERKTVFRSVVENPFRVQWPSVPLNAQNAILACLVDMLSAVAEHNLSRERTSRLKRKRRAAPAIVASKKSRILAELGPRSTTVDAPLATHEGDINNAAEAATVTPPILRSLAAGINEVTKRLETIARPHRHMVNSDIDKDGETAQGSIATSRDRLVVVCRADVDPPALVSHIPNLVATCNSRREGGGRTWLISLPKGAEHTLAGALGLRRAAAMLIEAPESFLPAIGPMLQNIPLLVAPWLESRPSVPSMTLVPTHIKQLRTTAPKDMRNAKEHRARGRAAAKERRRARRSPVPKRVTLTSEGLNVLPAAS
ncbi:uncharacterized protein TRAVEDRAFT_110159 [Trametes versicolor FP-101664 SS1]|uniref:uncharacterized protein n=1 Tax=Trametes versicolor (strain FP-101664) TaxID=717944 RepID=UPI0004623A35|nr:uncharacterized protein TRAVEDRAFT_110159 [Trametes versicolor FP-101664 SS1]EIW64352.1 hypothetical protein TRAVEDRAFT_110159 [Trametes versicolor FP-101664 SS1]